MKARLLPTLAALLVLALAGCTNAPDPGTAQSSSSTTTAASDPAKSPEGKAPETVIDPEAIAKETAAKENAAKEPAPVAKNAVETVATESPKTGDEVAVIETAKGRIVAMFRPDKAPKHVENFKVLAGAKFYDGTRFHRCIAGFMIQGGDPNSKDLGKADSWGTGGNIVGGVEKNVEAEFTDFKHTRGVLSMARSADPNSASSQFFIMHQDSPQLDGQYSAFGKVVSGIEVVDKIVVTGDANDNGKVEPSNAILVKSIRIERWPLKK